MEPKPFPARAVSTDDDLEILWQRPTPATPVRLPADSDLTATAARPPLTPGEGMIVLLCLLAGSLVVLALAVVGAVQVARWLGK